MRIITVVLLALLSSAPVLAGEVLGQAMPAGDAVPIDTALTGFDPKTAAATPQKFSGEITEVCQKEGCWMILAENEKFARVQMHDHAFSVPKDTRGRAIVYGTLTAVELSPERAKHLAEDAGRERLASTQEFNIDALAVELAD